MSATVRLSPGSTEARITSYNVCYTKLLRSPRATRGIINRLNLEHKLPVYVFTDGDPWGIHIAMVIISGSANAAHLRGLTTPDAKWIGVWGTDIVDYKLPTEPLTEFDKKRNNFV